MVVGGDGGFWYKIEVKVGIRGRFCGGRCGCRMVEVEDGAGGCERCGSRENKKR